MSSKARPLDYWRKFFGAADSDIFEVIQYAILVAASDCPKEFCARRDAIAQQLYTSRSIWCSGCNSVTLHTHQDDENGGFLGKESTINNSSTKVGDDRNRISDQIDDDEEEVLTEEIEEETNTVAEVMKIIHVLENQDESEDALFESLRRLKLMQMTLETVEVTGIGKVVNGLRKRVCSKQIRNLARKLVGCWKEAVNECLGSANVIAEDSQDLVTPACVEEEEGLPIPPMDAEVLLEIQTTPMELTSMELSQFFDGLDEDGNPQGDNNIEEKNCEHGKKSTTKNQKRKQEAVDNQTSVIHGHARNTGQEKPQEKLPKCSQVSESLKLEISKRKLQEAYQAAYEAKKARVVKVLELHNLPKQGCGHSRKLDHFKTGLKNNRYN